MSRTPKATVRDWRRGYGVVDPVDKEVISYSLWDRQSIVSGTTQALTFFGAPQTGQNGNLALAGQLANGTAFLIQAIRMCPLIRVTETAAAAPAAGPADGALQDMFTTVNTGSAVLRVGDKEYGKWPLFMLPAGGGPVGAMSNVGTLTAPASSQFAWATNGVPDPRSVYVLPIPIVIPPQYVFRVQVDWSAILTLVAGNSDLLCILDGELMRPKQ